MKTRAPRRALRRLSFLLAALVAVIAVANIPTTTRQGINYVVETHSLPLYVKALDFIDRDVHYRRLAADVTAGAATDEAKARAVFDWTRAHIHDQPSDLPGIDDHVWHIIVRGYGQSDQKADVFTTLTSYAGVPAYFIFVGPRLHEEIPLSFVEIDHRWRVADVANGVMFRSRDGRWATAEELAADTAFMAAQGPKTTDHDWPYAHFFEGFQAPIPPDLTRPDMQVPGARTWFRIKKVFGSGQREWEMRPASRLRAPFHRPSS